MMVIANNLRLVEIEYPEEDFEPMPEGDKQRRNLSYTTEALRLWFKSQKNVYVSGNLFIFYEENKPEKRVAPDTFVVFGMNTYDRTSYKIWKEGNKAPDFVLEFTSKGTVAKDQRQNLIIYRDLGVKEYFQYDPTGEYLKPNALQGVRLDQGEYVKIPNFVLPDRILSIPSEVLGLDLHLDPKRGFRFYDPVSQQFLLTYAESEFERSLERQLRLQAEQEIALEQRAKLQAEQKAQRLAERLKAMGIDPDEI
jgi:Uma2 family endonuclease